jgi:hypothetical protein
LSTNTLFNGTLQPLVLLQVQVLPYELRLVSAEGWRRGGGKGAHRQQQGGGVAAGVRKVSTMDVADAVSSSVRRPPAASAARAPPVPTPTGESLDRAAQVIVWGSMPTSPEQLPSRPARTVVGGGVRIPSSTVK